MGHPHFVAMFSINKEPNWKSWLPTSIKMKNIARIDLIRDARNHLLDFFQVTQNMLPTPKKQWDHDKELVLLIEKGCLPLRIVEKNFFRRHVHGRNPCVKIPNRRRLEKIVPAFIEECYRAIIGTRLNSMSKISIYFDLWISRGCEDIYYLIAHGMDWHFKKQRFHIRMVKCSITIVVYLEGVLKR